MIPPKIVSPGIRNADATNLRVDIYSETWTNYLAKDWLEVPFGITSWASRATPMAYMNLLFKSTATWNEAHYTNKKLDSLIDSAGSELNVAKRKNLFKQIELILSNDGPSIIPFYTVVVVAMRTALTAAAGVPVMAVV